MDEKEELEKGIKNIRKSINRMNEKENKKFSVRMKNIQNAK